MIELPFPPSSLSGHAKGHWRSKSNPTAEYRALAKEATVKARYLVPPGKDDISIHITFVPPDQRGDRVNFPNRMKPYFDGIAEALGVNDSRFVPHFHFCAPEKPGRVEVRIGT
jgi:crossover junction endodeoxyribonuclease RusA